MSSKKEEQKDKKEKPRLQQPTSILSDEPTVKEAKEKIKAKIVESDKKAKETTVTEVVAKARHQKISPRKVRLVIDFVRGMRAQEALEKLQFVNKKAAPLIIKLINSALANAENNFKLNKNDLYIKTFFANEGPSLHRWMPKAHGRANPILKRTSHITVILGLKEKESEAKGLGKKPLNRSKISKPNKKLFRNKNVKNKKIPLAEIKPISKEKSTV